MRTYWLKGKVQEEPFDLIQGITVASMENKKKKQVA